MYYGYTSATLKYDKTIYTAQVAFKNLGTYQEYSETLESVEREQAIHNVFSITTPLLRKTKEYQEADIVHFHMFHNTKLSIYGLNKIASEKKVILSIHDPWFLTGRCVHFYECNKWQNGCQQCPNLNNMFPLLKDNCESLWKLKHQIFNNIDVDLVCGEKELIETKIPIWQIGKRVFLTKEEAEAKLKEIEGK